MKANGKVGSVVPAIRVHTVLGVSLELEVVVELCGPLDDAILVTQQLLQGDVETLFRMSAAHCRLKRRAFFRTSAG